MVQRVKLKKLPSLKRRPKFRNGPHRLDDKLISQFSRYVRKGLTFETCCELLSINYSLFLFWKRCGESYLAAEGADREPKDEMCARFVRQYRLAFGQYKEGLNDRLHNSPWWRREMAILERRDRKNYARAEVLGGDEDQFVPDEKFL